MTLHSTSVGETRRFAEKLARHQDGCRIYALTGELGSGKTTFVQAFLRALGVRGRITSPTFLIIKSYQLKAKSYKLAYHIDCYRIKKIKELTALGLTEFIADTQNIVLIEWADTIRKLLPSETTWIRFKHGDQEGRREIVVQ